MCSATRSTRSSRLCWPRCVPAPTAAASWQRRHSSLTISSRPSSTPCPQGRGKPGEVFQHDSHALQYELDNERALIFVAVYNRALTQRLTYLPMLLAATRRIFLKTFQGWLSRLSDMAAGGPHPSFLSPLPSLLPLKMRW